MAKTHRFGIDAGNGPDATYCDQCEKAVFENYMEYCKTCGDTVCCDCYDMKKDMCKTCVV